MSSRDEAAEEHDDSEPAKLQKGKNKIYGCNSHMGRLFLTVLYISTRLPLYYKEIVESMYVQRVYSFVILSYILSTNK